MSGFSPAIREFLAAPEGARRLGAYRCIELVDEAGTAPVFRAVEEHAGLGLRDVALKVFDIGKRGAAARPGPAAERWRARVLDEARSLCRVQHPNVVRFHTLATDDARGLMGLVMEYVEGTSADKELESLPRGDDRRVALAVEIGTCIAAALAAAHEGGTVHCNVKPSNIMLAGGTHKLLNFGLSSSLGEAEEPEEPKARDLDLAKVSPESIGEKASLLPPAGATPLVGTLGYLDPVCLATTAPPTAASDLYALGATLYECLAGDVPAVATAKKGGEASGVSREGLRGDARPAPVSELAPSAPAELAKLVDALVAPTREARPRSAQAVCRALERVRSSLAGRERALPPADRGPFPGLDRYEASDRDVFFGRSAEIAAVLELARSRGLVGVVGLSGSGKSSLTRAGVVPAIEDGALGAWPPRWRSVVVTPGKDLWAALESALAEVLGAPLEPHPAAVVQQLAADVDAKGEGLVVLVDQLEEVVLKHDAGASEGRRRALELLSRLAEAPVGLRAVVVVRRDLLDAVLAVDPAFARALSRGVQLLGPLGEGAWEEAVDQGLDAFGYRFESDAVRKKALEDLSVRDAAMTLVQFGLARLWARRDTKTKTIPKAALEKDGGLRGALEHHADAAVAKLAREKVREVLLAMTTPEGARAHVPLETLTERFGADAKEVVFALTKARLVVSEKEGFTFVHDSVLREWSTLRGWLEDARDDRVLVAQIERDAARWADARGSVELWRKARLAAALDLWRKKTLPLSEPARAFLMAARSAEQREERFRFGLFLLVVASIVGGALVYAKTSADAADRARKDASAIAEALAEVKPLKHQMEENGMEAAQSAKLLHELQKQMAEERASYGANVKATLAKVASATSLDGAQKASAELGAQKAEAPSKVVPLPTDLLGSGPSAPKLDTSGPSPSAGGGAFDQGSIERVVAARKAGVKRTCLDRSASTAASTKVTATLTIAPNGSVQNVSTTGDDPVAGKCIEQQLRTWSFPAPGEPKTVQIPFVFVRQ